MTSTMRPQDLVDNTVVDPNGSKIGTVGTVYLTESTQQPEWVTVRTGMFGHKESFVPLDGANVDSDGLHVQVAKDQVSGAPRIDADGRLSQQDSVELYRYYGLPMPRSSAEMDPAGTDPTGTPAGRPGQYGQDQAGYGAGYGTEAGSGAGDSSEQGMVRSEERLNVGTEQHESGRVRLHRYVVTEERQVTVPVTHEEVSIEREPISGDAQTGGSIGGEDEQEIVLHAERPVVDKETVAVERVRMGTEQVTEQQTVSGEVRKEHIDIEDDHGRR